MAKIKCPVCDADGERFASSALYPKMGLRAYTCRVCGNVYSGLRDDDRACIKQLRRKYMLEIRAKGYDVSGLFKTAEPDKKIIVSLS